MFFELEEGSKSHQIASCTYYIHTDHVYVCGTGLKAVKIAAHTSTHRTPQFPVSVNLKLQINSYVIIIISSGLEYHF